MTPQAAQTPDISVIVLVWGTYVRFLHECLASALSQAGVRVEVVVVANGEQIDSPIADERVLIATTERRMTLGACWNVGVAHARGEFLCFVGVDDILVEGALAFLVDRLRRRPELVSAACALEAWEPQTGRVTPLDFPNALLFEHADRPRLFAWQELLEHRVPIGSSLHRAEAVRSAGFPDIDLSEDWALAARLYWRGRAEYHERVAVRYRQHGGIDRQVRTVAELAAEYRAVRRWAWRDPMLPLWVRPLWPWVIWRHRQRARGTHRILAEQAPAAQ